MNLNKYINLPYKNLGRDFDGVDCFGLGYLIFKEEKGIIIPDFTDLKYNQDWYKCGENHIYNNMNENWLTEVEPPYKFLDGLIFYGIEHKTVANHIGFYVGNGRFIHILENSTSMINRLKGFWESKLFKGMRYIGG